MKRNPSFREKEKKSSFLHIIDKQFNFPEFKEKMIKTTEIIGKGGFGKVFKGVLNSLPIAKKTMKKLDLPSFIREVLLTHFLRNVNSPAVLGVEENSLSQGNKELSIILELIVGENLSSKIDKIKDSIKSPEIELQCLLYMIDLAKSLEFLHGNNIIHRDIKIT